MRNGELYALQWTDVDFENRSVTVSKSFNSRLNAVKSTKAGYWRAVPISSELKSLLIELRAKAGSTTHVLPRMWQWDKGNQPGSFASSAQALGSPRFGSTRCGRALRLS